MRELKFISNILEDEGIQYKSNHSLAKYSTFKVGGEAKFYVTPSSFREFKTLQKIVDTHNLPFFFIGGGSNLLVSDHGFDGVVIHPMTQEKIIIKKKIQNILWVRGRASSRSAWFAKTVSKMGYGGLEFLSTVPGSLGGAVVQNAGCYGSEIKDYVKKIFATKDGIAKIIKKAEADFSYRNSLFKKNNRVWVYAVEFELYEDTLLTINKRLEQFKNYRITSQPKNKKSAGSIFKNPKDSHNKLKAWELIDQTNLRGKKIGGATFSEEHCNFIVNENFAKASDIHQLILLAQETVKKQTGIYLETEIIRLGNFE